MFRKQVVMGRLTKQLIAFLVIVIVAFEHPVVGESVIATTEEEAQAYLRFNTGLEAHERGDIGLAESLYKKALELKPDLLEALNNLGNLYREYGDTRLARQVFQRAIAAGELQKERKTMLASILNNAGLLALYEGTKGEESGGKRIEGQSVSNPDVLRHEAIPAFERAMQLDTAMVNPPYNLGIVYSVLGDDARAVKAYSDALRRDPHHVTANMNLGNLYIKRGQYDLAEVYHTNAVEAVLNGLREAETGVLVGALNNLGQTLRESGNLLGAVNRHAQALQVDPSNLSALVQGIVAKRMLSLWARWRQDHHLLLATMSHAQSLYRRDLPPYDALLMPPSLFLSDPSVTLAKVAIASASSYFMDPSKLQLKKNQLVPGTPLRVGYLSYDMREHPMGYLTNGLYMHHRRDRVHVTVYMYGPNDNSKQRHRVEDAVDAFVDLFDVPTDLAAGRIARDNTDVVIDLMGHTKGARFDIAAQFPAPTYINYLGFPGTSGIQLPGAFIMADKNVIPAETAWSGLEITERILLLPESYQANDFSPKVAFCASALGVARFQACQEKSSLSALLKQPPLPFYRRPFRFMNANTLHKMEPLAFDVWSRVLLRVPRSILYMLEPKPTRKDFANVTENLLAEMAARGVDPERIIFMPMTTKEDHLDRLMAADLFLDSFVYGAHSTATDALWSGVPVLTLQGPAFPSRVGVSLLRALNMSELIAYSTKEFEDLAVRIAKRPALYLGLRAKLARSLIREPLFKSKRTTVHVENAIMATQNPLSRSHALTLVLKTPYIERDEAILTMDALQEEGMVLHRKNATSAAENLYWRMIGGCHSIVLDHKLRPKLAHAAHLTGLIHLDASLVRLAIAVESAGLYWMNLGYLMRKTGETEYARQYFVKALDLAVKELDVHVFSSSLSAMVDLRFTGTVTRERHLFIEEKDELVARYLRFIHLVQPLTVAREISATWVDDERMIQAFDTLSNVFEQIDLAHAAQILQDTATPFGLFRNRTLFLPRLFRSGVLYGMAKQHSQALHVHLFAVLEDNKNSFHRETLQQIRASVPPQQQRATRIVFYCNEYGQTWWPHWGPSSPETNGAGGSEEAVVFLSRELAKLGYVVEVYADPLPQDFGVTPASQGVIWLPHTAFDVDETVDVFVAWRYHVSLSLAKSAKKRFLWLHDVVPNLVEQLEELVQMNAVDRVLGVSDFHLATLPPSLPNAHRAAVLGLGLNEAFFVDGPNENTEFIYASAPNRGLEELLYVWPMIRSGLPHATLRIYYGFTKSFLRWGQNSMPEFERWLTVMKERIANLEAGHGVVYVGLVDHRELAVAYARSGFTLYPTSFPESGCIALMKAMAMGSIPITSRYQGSNVADLTREWDMGPPSKGRTIRGNAEFLQEYANAVIRAVTSHSSAELHDYRSRMKRWARLRFSWATKAVEFSSLLSN